VSASVQDAISAKVMCLVLLFFFSLLFTCGLSFSNGPIVAFIAPSASSTMCTFFIVTIAPSQAKIVLLLLLLLLLLMHMHILILSSF
jgi:hypothetical protein